MVQPRWNSGLRLCQTGAVWGLAAHFTRSTEPGQVAMPTGSGKTDVMTVLPFVVPTTRVLVVAPSVLLRGQLATAFRTLALLRDAGVVPDGVPAPKVAEVRHRLSSISDWNALKKVDVVLGTPGCLSPTFPDVAKPPKTLFDLVAVDEAHHVPAPSWAGLLSAFPDARVALFTATPFRRDRQSLPGLIAYNFPLRDAIRDGIYEPINFVPVAVPPATPESDFDRLLAKRAAGRLKDPVHRKGSSRLLIRTDSIEHADALPAVYAQVGLKVQAIHSNQSARTVAGVLKRLREGDLDGVVSVGLLGEGYDYPALKIAVYHRPHKSLAPTLQFVGRIARVQKETKAPAELIAIPEAVEAETRQLYAEDASWADLIPALTQAAIAEEQEKRAYVAALPPVPLEEFSLHGVRVREQAFVFELANPAEFKLDLQLNRLGQGNVIYSEGDQAGELLVVITEHLVRPEWLRTDALDHLEHELHVVVADRERELLYVNTSSPATCSEILKALGQGKARRLSPQDLIRILWGARVESYSSVGMRSARPPGGRQASYRTVAGTGANEAVMPVESAGYAAGHLIGRGRDANEQYKWLGVSIGKAKLWSTDSVDLLNFKRWCGTIGSYRATRPPSAYAPALALTIPERLVGFPDAGAVATLLLPALIGGDAFIELPNGELIDLALPEMTAERLSERIVRLSVAYEGEIWRCDMRSDGLIAPRGPDPRIVLQSNPHVQQTLSQVLTVVPPTIYFSDGSSTHRDTLVRLPRVMTPLPASQLVSWDWGAANIREEKMGSGTSVQDHTLAWTDANLHQAIVIHDDGSGEISDIIAVEQLDRVRLHLFHCKKSSESAPGHRVDDLYELVGQAARSMRWTHPRVLWPALTKRLKERALTRLVRGDLDATTESLTALATDPPLTDVVVYLVQPGLRIEGATSKENINLLLVLCDQWLSQHSASLVVVGS